MAYWDSLTSFLENRLPLEPIDSFPRPIGPYNYRPDWRKFERQGDRIMRWSEVNVQACRPQVKAISETVEGALANRVNHVTDAFNSQ